MDDKDYLVVDFSYVGDIPVGTTKATLRLLREYTIDWEWLKGSIADRMQARYNDYFRDLFPRRIDVSHIDVLNPVHKGPEFQAQVIGDIRNDVFIIKIGFDVINVWHEHRMCISEFEAYDAKAMIRYHIDDMLKRFIVSIVKTYLSGEFKKWLDYGDSK